MTSNVFDRLLLDFQEAGTQFQDYWICIYGYSPYEEFICRLSGVDSSLRRIGFLHTDQLIVDGAKGFGLYFPYRRYRESKWMDEWLEPLECFKRIATQAGFALPDSIRLMLNDHPENYFQAWIDYMWAIVPKSWKDLEPIWEFPFFARPVFRNPFHEAAEAIRLGGLQGTLGDLTHGVLIDPPSNDCSHSDDFTSVNWYGQKYYFSKGQQAEVVRALWGQWENGGHSLSKESIMDTIGSENEKFEMRKLFRSRGENGGYIQHPAWRTMIQEVTKGVYAIVPPSSK